MAVAFFSRSLRSWDQRRPIAVGLLILFASVTTVAAETVASTSQANFGESHSAAECSIILAGGAKREVLNAEIGSLRSTWSAATLPDQGATVSATLQVSATGTTPVLLEIEEIHQRRDQSFGCTVSVNGTLVYFRSYEEMGAGPVRYYVQVPRKLVPDGRLYVQIRNEGNAPLSLRRLWAHGDFFALANREGIYETMPVFQEALTLLPALAAKGENVPGQAQQKAFGTPIDDAAWKDLQNRVDGTGYATGPFINLQYALMPFDQIKRSIDQGLERVAKLGTPFQIAFNGGEWGSHPNGMDGLGGFFSDVTYSTIGFDPVTKTYRPCWPGTPGGTTWPAWNDPQLQRYLAYKLKKSVRYYLDRRDFMAAQGVTLPFPPINQDWGLAAGADCSDSTVAAAQRDGIELTQEDGLDKREKAWKYRNMSQIPQRFGKAFLDAAQATTVIVDQGTLRLPGRQTVDDYYFQTFSDAANSPFRDDRWAGWQFAVGENTWATGEFLPHLPEPYFDYIKAQGKLTCPNLERMALPTLEYLQVCYERGFRAIWICNARSGDVELYAPQGKGQDERPCRPVITANRKLLDLNYRALTTVGSDQLVVSGTNIFNPPPSANPPIGALADGLQVKDATLPGTLRYRLEDEGRPLAGGLLLDLTAHFESEKDSAVEIAIGSSLDALTPITRLTVADFPALKTYPWTRSARVNLGDSLLGKRSGILQISLINKSSTKGVVIDSLRATQPWPTPSGHQSGEPFTVKQMRTLNLWTQDRAMLERMQRRYRQRQGNDEAYRTAEGLAAQGLIRSAYRHLSDAYSQLLPARFAIRGHGRLGTSPVEIALDNPNNVLLTTLTKASESEIVFQVTTEKTQDFSVRITGLSDSATYVTTATGDNAWSIRKASGSTSVRVDTGTLTLNLRATLMDDRRFVLPSKLSGSFKSTTAGGILIDTQAEGLWFDNPIFIPVAASTAYRRTAVGSTADPTNQQPQPYDHVELTIDTTGVAQEVKATFGRIQGTIASFQAPVLKGSISNGIITLTNGSSYEFANYADWTMTKLDVPKLKQFIRFNTSEDLQAALKPGLKVDIIFCPYTVNGRLPRMISLKAERPPRDPNLAPALLVSEGVQLGWFKNGWDSTIDPMSTTMAKTGTRSFAATITAPGGAAGFFHLDSTFDCTPYGTISFWINGGAIGGQQLKMVLYEGGQSFKLPSPLVANTWVHYQVKLSDIGAKDLDDLQALRFLDQNGTCLNKTFYIDDLAFIP